MRILIAHSRYLSGEASGENQVVADEARLLSEAGHDVEVWEPSLNGVGGTELVRVAARTVRSPKLEDGIRARVRNHCAEIVHCHNLFPALTPGVLTAAAEEGAGVVMTLHNYRLMCLPGTFVRQGRICEDCIGRTPVPGVVHRCYRGSALGSAALATSHAVHRRRGTYTHPLYLAASHFLRDKHIEGGWPAARIKVKPNFAWDQAPREGPGDYFLYLGRLSSEKGVATLLEAWRSAPGKLIVVGDGPEASELRAAAPPGVEFFPPVDRSQALELIRSARALMVPSICYEGGPRAILEAYAAGVPALASRIGSLPEVVDDGMSGLLVGPREPQAWVDAARRLSNDSESVRLGEGASSLWRSRFNPERNLAALEAAYADATSP